MKPGAVEFLTKPFQDEGLLDTISANGRQALAWAGQQAIVLWSYIPKYDCAGFGITLTSYHGN
jgi:hypothetical protein